jgi:hypothetical protein
MITPKFEHDCNRCVYLGSDSEHDFYICKDENHPQWSTLLARFGSRGDQYCSMEANLVEQIIVGRPLDTYPLLTARLLAIGRKLLKPGFEVSRRARHDFILGFKMIRLSEPDKNKTRQRVYSLLSDVLRVQTHRNRQRLQKAVDSYYKA